MMIWIRGLLNYWVIPFPVTLDLIYLMAYALAVREHVMIYRIENKSIYLVRVLHGKMNFTFQFLK